MLHNHDCAVSKELGHLFQAYPPVKASGSICVPGDMREDLLFTWTS